MLHCQLTASDTFIDYSLGNNTCYDFLGIQVLQLVLTLTDPQPEGHQDIEDDCLEEDESEAQDGQRQQVHLLVCRKIRCLVVWSHGVRTKRGHTRTEDTSTKGLRMWGKNDWGHIVSTKGTWRRDVSHKPGFSGSSQSPDASSPEQHKHWSYW